MAVGGLVNSALLSSMCTDTIRGQHSQRSTGFAISLRPNPVSATPLWPLEPVNDSLSLHLLTHKVDTAVPDAECG